MATESLPIFPLSNVVLFPGLSTPLHLFEPRYRQLARDVIAGDGRIGMVVVRPEFSDDMVGDPPVYPIGCAGTITEHEKLPDGRYNLVLHGEHRFRIVGEEPREDPRLYRVARAVALEDPYPESDRERVARLRATVLEAMGTLLRKSQPDKARTMRAELFEGVDDATFVNLLSNALALPVEEKQSLVEADSTPERFARLAALLSFQRAEVEASEDPNRGSLH